MLKIQTQAFILCFLYLGFFTFQYDAQFFIQPALFSFKDWIFPSMSLSITSVLSSSVINGIGVIPLIVVLLLLLSLLLLWIQYRARCKELNRLKKEAGELYRKNAAKDKFFSIIGHDLKSPFNSLMGLSEILMLHSETMNQTEVLDYSKMVHQSTVKLFALVENLLQWSRTQMGNTDYNPEKLDLNILTGNVVSLLRLSAQEKDIVIALKMEPDLLCFADANIYSTVLRNLVGNAIKFSRVGSVIHVSGRRKADGMICIEVSDLGIGMNSEQLEKVFRIDTAQSTVGTFNEKGTGLGLILSKEFVELNRGTIQIISRMGEGTKVSFTVPSVLDEGN